MQDAYAAVKIAAGSPVESGAQLLLCFWLLPLALEPQHGQHIVHMDRRAEQHLGVR